MIRVAFLLLLVASGTVGISLGDRPGGHVTHVVGHGGARRGTCDTCRGVCWLAAVHGTFAATDCTIGYLQACATARLKTGRCKPTITTTFLCCQTCVDQIIA